MLKFLTDLRWPEVFDAWQKNEVKAKHWEDIWKAKGFSSWEEWRSATHANLHGERVKEWRLYRVTDPLQEIPKWYGGMFHGWLGHYANLSAQPPTLGELATIPYVQNQPYINGLVNEFPPTTIMMAIKTPNERIYVTEGMHRGCAIALAAQRKLPLHSIVTVMLGLWPSNDPPKLGLGWNK